MANKKKTKPEFVMVATIVPTPHSRALKLLADKQDRSVSKIVKRMIEESIEFQAALKEIQAA